MHIGIIIGYGLSGSGSTVYALDLANNLTSKGYRVTLFCHEQRRNVLQSTGSLIKEDSEYTHYKVAHTFNIYSLKYPQIPVTYERPEMYNTKNLADFSEFELLKYRQFCSKVITKVTKDTPLDLIVANHLGAQSLVAYMINKLQKTPYKCIVHGTAIEYGLKNSPELLKQVRTAVDSAKNVVVLNQAVKDRTLKFFPEFEDKLEIIPPGVDTLLFSKEAFSKKIAYVGRLSFDKGIHAMLLSIPFVTQKYPELHYEIAGDGPDSDLLKLCWKYICSNNAHAFLDVVLQASKQRKNEDLQKKLVNPISSFLNSINFSIPETFSDRISWLGHTNRQKTAEIYKKSDLVILPSLAPEAYPLTICESFSAGTAVIGTNTSGIASLFDIVESDLPQLKDVFRVQCQNDLFVKNLIEKTIHHIESPLTQNDRIKLSKYALKKFSWDKISDLITSQDQFLKKELLKKVK